MRQWKEDIKKETLPWRHLKETLNTYTKRKQ